MGATLPPSVLTSAALGAAGGAILDGSNQIALGIAGQSNEHGEVYAQLVYTIYSASGDGQTATVSTGGGFENDLKPGDTVYGQMTGAAPAGYNTSGFIAMTVGGAYPNATLSYPSTGTGGLTSAGTLTIDQTLSYPQAFRSNTTGEKTPIGPSVTQGGGWWFRLLDQIYTNKKKRAVLVNGAIGSQSFINHAAGITVGWQAASHYRVARSPLGNGDLGSVGSVLVVAVSGHFAVFECTSGGDQIYATYNGGLPIPATVATGSVIQELDYIYTVAGAASGGSAPTWSNVTTVGQTITDGGLTWTCRCLNTSTTTVTAFLNLTPYQVLTQAQYGFDPLGLMYRLVTAMLAIKGVGKRIICISNGQADTFAAGQTWYADALNSMTNFYLSKGLYVAIGLSCYNPSEGSTANYTSLSASVASVLAGFSGNSYVLNGANLFTALGSTPGAGGLYLQSDNNHQNEKIHLSGAGAYAAGDAWYNALQSYL